MSISWGVVPVVPEALDWLQKAGYEFLKPHSRYPTLDELLTALESFHNLPLRKEESPNDLWNIVIGILDSSHYAHILGSIRDDGLFHFHFWGSGCQEETMVQILRALTPACGPLVLYEKICVTPLLITATTNLQEALAEWNERYRTNYDRSNFGAVKTST